MIRRIIVIDQEKCNGCGACADACHEGAIGMVNGKAVLLREDYCDGLGDCLPSCPTGAISFETREAAAYDEEAVARHMAQRGMTPANACPGQMARQMAHKEESGEEQPGEVPSQLAQWPVQLQLVPVNAPYLKNAHLLIAADCTAYAYGDFHRRFMKGRVTLIGCPKLDPVAYAEKLKEIFQTNDIQSVTLVRMEVPCCGGMERAVTEALQQSGAQIPYQVETVSVDGNLR
ncbi:MAG: ATP-binding protein [Oscillospiraceae bacterium]|jgi:ferredoxin